MSILRDYIDKLPPDMEQEVKDFIEFLIQKRNKRPREKPKFDWADTLKNLGKKYTSVELQHKISEWRIRGQ